MCYEKNVALQLLKYLPRQTERLTLCQLLPSLLEAPFRHCLFTVRSFTKGSKLNLNETAAAALTHRSTLVPDAKLTSFVIKLTRSRRVCRSSRRTDVYAGIFNCFNMEISAATQSLIAPFGRRMPKLELKFCLLRGKSRIFSEKRGTLFQRENVAEM